MKSLASTCTLILMLASAVAGAQGEADKAKVPTYAAPEQLPGSPVVQVFKNKADKKGNIRGLEFSSAQLFDGRLFLADDESRAISVLAGGAKDSDGLALLELKEDPAGKPFVVSRPWSEHLSGLGRYDDVEALAATEDTIYLFGSASANNDGERKKDREFILRYSPSSGKKAILRPVELNAAFGELIQADPARFEARPADAAGAQKRFNLEGATIVPASKDVLLGLRRPLLGPKKKAVVLRLRNVDALVDDPTAKPELELVTLLDLNGAGISSLEYDPLSQRILISAVGDEQKSSTSSLWSWKGDDASSVQEHFRLDGHRIEGVARITDGPMKDKLVITMDEERKEADYGIVAVMSWSPDGGESTASVTTPSTPSGVARP